MISALGLMSGTSLDGVDVAWIKTDGEGHIDTGPSLHLPYTPEDQNLLREALMHARDLTQRDERPPLIARAEALIDQRHIEAVEAFRAAYPALEIELIGYHGQTILHRPEARLTVQIGRGQVLADALNCPVLFDMRAADVAAGGQGAPLVPVYHRALARAAGLRFPVGILNIGGLANLTYLPSAEALVEIGAHLSDQRINAIFKEMVGPGNNGMFNHNAFLCFQLFNQAGDLFQGRNPILIAMNKQTGGRAGRQKRKIKTVGGRGHRNKPLDFGAAHQQLHSDPRTEGHAGNPAGARIRADGLCPVQRRGCIRKLACAVVKCALTAANPAKIEAQHRKATLGKGIIHIIHDLIVHRAAKLRVRMQDDGNRRALLLGRMVSAFQTSRRTGKNNFRHIVPLWLLRAGFRCRSVLPNAQALDIDQWLTLDGFRTILSHLELF